MTTICSIFRKTAKHSIRLRTGYISAMRARMGLDLFLHAERTVVEELIQKEEKKTRDASERLNTVKQESEQRQSVRSRRISSGSQSILHCQFTTKPPTRSNVCLVLWAPSNESFGPILKPCFEGRIPPL